MPVVRHGWDPDLRRHAGRRSVPDRATFGFFYELGDTVDLIVAVNSALGVPKFTLNFDIGVGIGFRI